MSSSDKDTEFVTLLTKHQMAIQVYVQSLMPGDSMAEDVAQKANIALWKKKNDFETGTNFKAWAFAVARYEVLIHRKRQAREGRLLVFSEDLESVFTRELPESDDGLENQLDALRKCLGKLSPKFCNLLRYRYFEEGTLREYAKKVGRSVGGLKVTLHRIRNTLLLCIEKRIKAEEAGK